MNLQARIETLDLDRWGIWASVLCALHCALFPILVTIGGLSVFDAPILEVIVLGLSFLIAVSSLIPSYLHHHRKVALLIVIAAFGLIALGHVSNLFWSQVGFTVAGALGIALAHLVNQRLRSDCAKCCS